MEQYPQTSPTTHHSTKIVIIASIVVVILGIILILIGIRERRAYEAYLKTPEGQLQLLRDTSSPVTSTPEEQLAILKQAEKSSVPVNKSREELQKELNMLGKQQQ